MKFTNSRNAECPMYAKGRWYHMFLESNGTTITVTDCDAGLKKTNVISTYINMHQEEGNPLYTISRATLIFKTAGNASISPYNIKDVKLNIHYTLETITAQDWYNGDGINYEPDYMMGSLQYISSEVSVVIPDPSMFDYMDVWVFISSLSSTPVASDADTDKKIEVKTKTVKKKKAEPKAGD